MKKLMLVVGGILIFGQIAHAEQAASTIKGTAPQSEIYGNATFKDAEKGVDVEIEIFGAPAGSHGIHLHETGSCEDAGNAAGGHYNPDNVPHGLLTKDGVEAAHAGDLGNIEIGEDGHGVLKLNLPDLSVTDGPYEVEGRAVILHEKADDFGQPTGNAGGRIACGVIELQK